MRIASTAEYDCEALNNRFLCSLVLSLLMFGGCDSERTPTADPGTKKPAVTQPATRPVVREDIAVDEFDKLWREKKYIILDVRTQKEFAAGHIPGAVNLDVKSPDFEKKVLELDKQQPYLVHCASGVRSLTACDRMTKLQFEHLYNLKGGFSAWARQGKAVEKGESAQ